MSSPDVSGRPNASAATEPAMSAVSTTPGTARSVSPTATRLRTRVDSWSPPWKRMNDTPSDSRSCAPIESSGMSIASETDGPSSTPANRSTSIRGIRAKSAMS